MTELNKLAYCVQQSGYTVDFGTNVIVQELEGGPSRYRVDSKNNVHYVNSTWVVGKKGYQYMMAFFNVWQRNPSQPFLANLIIDDAELDEYECFFRNGGFRLDSKNGQIYTLSATLEVTAKPRDDDMDDALVMLGNGNTLDIFDPLEKLVNEDLPDALENLNV